jgi:hypothetical protein
MTADPSPSALAAVVNSRRCGCNSRAALNGSSVMLRQLAKTHPAIDLFLATCARRGGKKSLPPSARYNASVTSK